MKKSVKVFVLLLILPSLYMLLYPRIIYTRFDVVIEGEADQKQWVVDQCLNFSSPKHWIQFISSETISSFQSTATKINPLDLLFYSVYFINGTFIANVTRTNLTLTDVQESWNPQSTYFTKYPNSSASKPYYVMWNGTGYIDGKYGSSSFSLSPAISETETWCVTMDLECNHNNQGLPPLIFWGHFMSWASGSELVYLDSSGKVLLIIGGFLSIMT
ncbi:MAG: hypothetical protein ACTSUV_01660 [Candidatus Ranarchaeia archaeon]